MKSPAVSLPEQVAARLGPERFAALSGQPLCLANGGMDAVLQAACTPEATLIQATVRTLQLCGSHATPADLE